MVVAPPQRMKRGPADGDESSDGDSDVIIEEVVRKEEPKEDKTAPPALKRGFLAGKSKSEAADKADGGTRPKVGKGTPLGAGSRASLDDPNRKAMVEAEAREAAEEAARQAPADDEAADATRHLGL